MAKNDKNTAPAADVKDDFDYSQFLPEGYDAKELRKVGGLTPIYAAGPAYENKWPPCAGWIVGIEVLDMGGEHKDPKQRFRPFLRLESTCKTKAAVGKKREQEIVDIDVGQDILMPLSGNIRNVKEIQIASADPKNTYLGIFRVTGSRQVNDEPSEMWVIDSRLHPKARVREGRFLLTQTQNIPAQMQEGGVTATGEVFDKHGVIQTQAAQA